MITFHVEEEFVMASTVHFLHGISESHAKDLLAINDTIKLVKLFSLNEDEAGKLQVELGFELWAGSWSRESLFAFLDMLCLGIEKVLEKVEKQNIPHDIKFVTYK